VNALLAVIVRLLAFVGKELVETIRRPGAILSLVLGPFLIMAIFGLGYDGYRRPLRTVAVIPPQTGLPQDVQSYETLAGTALEIVEITDDPVGLEQRLAAQDLDVVIIAPTDAQEQFRAGRQTTVEVVVNITDPVQAAYATFVVQLLTNEINREIIQRVAEEGQDYAVSAGQEEAARIPPEVVAEPTRSELRNIAPLQPGVVAFFAPAVLALILQHLAVTLVAMSLIRERTSGVLEVFRISPIGSAEIIGGKVVAYGVIGGAIGLLTLALLTAGLGIPLLGGAGLVVGVVMLLLLASIGLGLLVAVLSDSERQVVQMSLLILLASVFFSGFVLPLDEFSRPVQALAYMLPVTHGIRLMQDLMLRGTTVYEWQYAALAAIAAVSLVLSWLLLRRSMTRS
jgi:ABC-2 type transport system permease protein